MNNLEMQNLENDIKELAKLLSGKFERDVISTNIIAILFALRLEHILKKDQTLSIEDPDIQIKDYNSLYKFCRSFEEVTDDRVFKIFDPLSDEDIGRLISEELVEKIIDKFLAYDLSISTTEVDEFGVLFSRTLHKYPINYDGYGIDSSSKDISNQFSVYVENVQKETLDLLDPAFGLGFSAIEIVNNNRDKVINLNGYEVEERVYDFARMNLIANGIYSFKLHNQDSLLTNWEESYDLIISEPPFGVPISKTAAQIGDLACDLFLKSMNFLNPTGEIIFLMSKGVLVNVNKFSIFREALVDSGKLHSVVQLPANVGALYTNIETCLIHFKNYKADNKVVMIELDDLELLSDYLIGDDKSIKHSRVSFGDIKQNDFILDPKRYTSKVFDDIKELVSENRVIQLKHILKPTKKLRIGDWYETSMNFRIEHHQLKDDPFDSVLNVGDVDDEYDPNHSNKGNLLINISDEDLKRFYLVNTDKSVLLVSRLGHKLKPTLLQCDFPNEAVYVKDTIHSYSVIDNRFYSHFIAYQLHSKLVKEQLEVYRQGGTVKYISRSDFLNLYIEIPVDKGDLFQAQIEYLKHIENLEFERLYNEKKQEVKSLSVQLKDTRKKEKERKDFEEEMIVDYINHNVRNHLSGVKDYMDLIYGFMKKNEGNSIDLTAVEGAPLAGEKIEHLPTMNDYFQKSLSGLVNALQALKNLEDFRVDSFKEEQFIELNIYEWLQSYCQKKNHLESFSVNISTKESNTDLFVTKIVESPFENVLNNLLENVMRHGFTEASKANKIEFDLKISNDQIVIDYLNNGEPFQIPFENYISQGKAGGNNAGTGFGGFFIYRTIQNLNGDLSFIDEEESSLWNVHLQIKLPLTITE